VSTARANFLPLPQEIDKAGTIFQRHTTGNPIAFAKRMSTNSVSSLTNNNYLELLLNSALQTSGASANNNNSINSAASSAGQNSDASQLSPFAQILSTLQQLQQSDPSEYATLTQQIAKNLQSAAQTDTADGNTSGASQLTQLATDFSTASSSGQLPNISDLAQAIGGPSQPPEGSSSSIFQQLEQLLASLQANSSASQSLSPQSIILQTLSNAGITSSGN
jgi:hypothetical protein